MNLNWTQLSRTPPMHKTIEILLEDKPGTLMRAAGLVTAMGSNIHSLAVQPDPAAPGRSRLTLSAELTPRQLDLILRKLKSFVQVFDARELPGHRQFTCPICKEVPPPWTTPPA
jgi:acetolactate synthase small subunit